MVGKIKLNGRVIIVSIAFLLSFTSSLIVNFLVHGFADGWWTASAALLKNHTLYRDVRLWTTPLRVMIAYYLNLLGPLMIWEKAFGFTILLGIWLALSRINYFLTAHVVAAIAFSTVSISLGQMFPATVYYDYNLLTLFLAILLIVNELERLKFKPEDSRNSSLDKIFFASAGFLIVLLIANKYTDGILSLLLLGFYFIGYYKFYTRPSKNRQDIIIELGFFLAGTLVAIVILWLLGSSFIDYQQLLGTLLQQSRSKNLSTLSVVGGFTRHLVAMLIRCWRYILAFDIADFITTLSILLLPFIIILNLAVCLRSIRLHDRDRFLSREQQFICFFITLIGAGNFLSTTLSGGGYWVTLPYFTNVLPVSIIVGCSLRIGERDRYIKILNKFTVMISVVSIILSIHKAYHPYSWWFPSGSIDLRNRKVIVESSGYYAYLPVEEEFARVVRELCRALDDRDAAVLSYPIPFANLACARQFPLAENIFWYDVAAQEKIRHLFDWLKQKHDFPVYVVYFSVPQDLEFHEKIYGAKPLHWRLKIFFSSQNSQNKNSLYTLLKQLKYKGMTLTIYKSSQKE